MSLFLHRLGHLVGRYRIAVIAGWLVILGAASLTAAHLGTHHDNGFSIPGADSQRGLDLLSDRFPGVSAASTPIIFTTSSGSITEGESRTEVAVILDELARVNGVDSVSDPFAESSIGAVSKDGLAALATVTFAEESPSASTTNAVRDALDQAGDELTAIPGGSLFSDAAGGEHTAEIVGVAIALLVLTITFGSLLAAGLPLVTALAGVLITTAFISVATSFGSVSSTAPAFATMLGLAVGIDYALFLVSRYRRELREDVEPQEAMARSLGTAGGAVVFAGLTVIIALLGLTVVNIPFLTVMGVAGAFAILLSVLIAITLVPAIALLFGRRLAPRRVKTARTRIPHQFSRAWIRLVTGRPALTTMIVVGGLSLCAVPATQIALALPDASTEDASSTQRQAYDAVTEHFGAGYNSPLVITGSILASDSPLDAIDALADRLTDMDGVVEVTTSVPNAGLDTVYISMLSEGGQNDLVTSELVQRIRNSTASLEQESGVDDILVTGITAVNIDVSKQLADSLLPYAVVVVSLSLVLLLIVFRSIAIPIKATGGYLLSVGAALGATVAAFQWGWLEPITGGATGTVASFLPIIVMGVLFGLAMDYEMFLVSGMHEHWAKQRDPSAAVEVGFTRSAGVVTAAAIIMFFVFAAFIPTGPTAIRPIAFALAIGVLVDAFIVRMTLVPAILALLGNHAWSIPKWLGTRLLTVDIEGGAIGNLIDAETRAAQHGRSALFTDSLITLPGARPLSVRAELSEASVVIVESDVEARNLALVLAGRRRPFGGIAEIGGLLLPEQSRTVSSTVALVDLRASADGRVDHVITGYISETVGTGRRARILFSETLQNLHTLSRSAGSAVRTDLSVRRMLELTVPERLIVEAAFAVTFGSTILVVDGISGITAARDLQRLKDVVAALKTRSITLIIPLTEEDDALLAQTGMALALPRMSHASATLQDSNMSGAPALELEERP